MKTQPPVKPPEPFPVERISLRQIFVLVLAQLNLERGIGYTILKLIKNPRAAVREYLFEDRKRMVNPLGLLLLTVAIATFISVRTIPPSEELIEQLEVDTAFQQMPESFQQGLRTVVANARRYLNLWFFASLPGLALASFLVYRRLGLNFAEHLVINSYLFAVQMVAYSLVIPFAERIPGLAVVIPMYLAYAYIRIFSDSIGRGIVEWIVTVLLTQVFSVLGVSVVATILLAIFNR